jgi:hypothetical protein
MISCMISYSATFQMPVAVKVVCQCFAVTVAVTRGHRDQGHDPAPAVTGSVPAVIAVEGCPSAGGPGPGMISSSSSAVQVQVSGPNRQGPDSESASAPGQCGTPVNGSGSKPEAHDRRGRLEAHDRRGRLQSVGQTVCSHAGGAH